MSEDILKPEQILISRTDAIGDVVLTLPLCGLLKKHKPNSRILFLGKEYTRQLVSACQFVDEFVSYDDWEHNTDNELANFLRSLKADSIIHVLPNPKIARAARKARIKNRIGTRNRFYHWINCNRLIALSRKNSPLHESQLNIILAKGVGVNGAPALEDIPALYGLTNLVPLKNNFSELLDNKKFNLIIHPKSRGNGKEWPLEKYSELISLLDPEKFRIFVSGTTAELQKVSDWIKTLPDTVVNLMGKMPLDQFISFIAKADGLLASGTGPVHLAAALAINTLGLYPECRPIHAGRWGPIGLKAVHLEGSGCDLSAITPQVVYKTINSWCKQ